MLTKALGGDILTKKTGDSTMRINSLILNIKKHVCIIMPNELTSSYPNLFSV